MSKSYARIVLMSKKNWHENNYIEIKTMRELY